MNTETFRDMLNKNDQTWNNAMQEVNVANIFLGALCILVTAPFWMVMTICLMIANLWFAFKEFVLENE